MTTQSRTLPPYMSVIWPVEGRRESRALRALILAVVGVGLLAASAHIQIGFPVPMTLQTGVVLLIGLAYGWKLGLATVVLYLAMGAAGLPVFTGLMKYTSGFLVGFAFAALVTGFAAERARHWLVLVGAVILAEVIVFVLGVGYLTFVEHPSGDGIFGRQRAIEAGEDRRRHPARPGRPPARAGLVVAQRPLRRGDER